MLPLNVQQWDSTIQCVAPVFSQPVYKAAALILVQNQLPPPSGYRLVSPLHSLVHGLGCNPSLLSEKHTT